MIHTIATANDAIRISPRLVFLVNAESLLEPDEGHSPTLSSKDGAAPLHTASTLHASLAALTISLNYGLLSLERPPSAAPPRVTSSSASPRCTPLALLPQHVTHALDGQGHPLLLGLSDVVGLQKPSSCGTSCPLQRDPPPWLQPRMPPRRGRPVNAAVDSNNPNLDIALRPPMMPGL